MNCRILGNSDLTFVRIIRGPDVPVNLDAACQPRGPWEVAYGGRDWVETVTSCLGRFLATLPYLTRSTACLNATPSPLVSFISKRRLQRRPQFHQTVRLTKFCLKWHVGTKALSCKYNKDTYLMVVMPRSGLVQFKGHFAWTLNRTYGSVQADCRILDWTLKDRSSRFGSGNP